VLIRVSGKLKSGRPSDVNFKHLFKEIYNKAAYFVMRNTSKLTSQEFEEIRAGSETAEHLEEEIIKHHLGMAHINFTDKEEEIIKKLIQVLSEEQKESEKKYEWEARLKTETDKVLSF
jgi:hypothetical protein